MAGVAPGLEGLWAVPVDNNDVAVRFAVEVDAFVAAWAAGTDAGNALQDALFHLG